jgi:hypothetical protein
MTAKLLIYQINVLVVYYLICYLESHREHFRFYQQGTESSQNIIIINK